MGRPKATGKALDVYGGRLQPQPCELQETLNTRAPTAPAVG